jgi:hypothetical protein
MIRPELKDFAKKKAKVLCFQNKYRNLQQHTYPASHKNSALRVSFFMLFFANCLQP